jgi:hypothetical protein
MPAAEAEPQSVAGPPPRSLQPVIYLLLANLGLSILLTIAVFIVKDRVINFQVAHTHLRTQSNASPDEQLKLARTSAQIGIWSRVLGNVILSVVYGFLVRALLRGKRRAYVRVLWLSIGGIVSLVFLWTTPYPSWIRIEQVLQSFLLAAILYRITRPEVRAYFAKQPREGKRRFGRF